MASQKGGDLKGMLLKMAIGTKSITFILVHDKKYFNNSSGLKMVKSTKISK